MPAVFLARRGRDDASPRPALNPSPRSASRSAKSRTGLIYPLPQGARRVLTPALRLDAGDQIVVVDACRRHHGAAVAEAAAWGLVGVERLVLVLGERAKVDEAQRRPEVAVEGGQRVCR